MWKAEWLEVDGGILKSADVMQGSAASLVCTPVICVIESAAILPYTPWLCPYDDEH